MRQESKWKNKPPKSSKALTKREPLSLKSLVSWNTLYLLASFLLFYLIGSTIILLLERNERFEQLKNQNRDIHNTAEFQLSLYPSKWKNRTSALNDFFSYFEEISGYPFRSQELIVSHRNQFYIHINNCNPKYDVGFRLRNYIWGPLINTSTLDGKMEKCDEVTCASIPLDPAFEYFEQSAQKLEHDIHPCSNKYSRETRIDSIPPHTKFATCGDLHKFFPNLWSENEKHNKLSYTENEVWYSGIYTGTFENGVRFKSDVTILYNNLDELEKGNILNEVKGEYSLRIWSMNDGYSKWNQTSFDEVANWYHLLCEKFGSYQNYPCPDDRN